MSSKKIKFAIIGCGRIAYRHIEAIQANPETEVVALCDLNLERAKERAAGLPLNLYQNYHEMLRKEAIDVVCIMTPSGMHAEHALDVMTSFKKHVVIEKPIALKISDGKALIETARKLNLEVFAVHQNRFNKAIQKIKTAIDGNYFGRIALATIRIRWSRGQAYYDRDPWRGIWALDGGALTNQAIHHIDLLRWLAGDVESVSAIGATQFVNVEVEDTATAWIKFKNGALGSIEVTTAARPLNNDLEASISILGEKGAAIVEGTAVNKLTQWTFEPVNPADFSEDPPNVYGFGHDLILQNVVDTLRGHAEPVINAEDALKTLRLLHAIYRSIELKGKEVFLSDEPVSSKLGVIDKKAKAVADLYRTGRMTAS